MSKYLFLTGATGLVGQYLLRDLLLAGQHVAVLIRPQGKASAQARLDAILAHWEAELSEGFPRPVCLEGDITCPGLGLSGEGRRWMANHVRAVIHNAASLTFDGKDRSQDPWLSNLTGTSHVLEVCRQAGLRDLHYVSTAYVCGKRPGLFGESELVHDCAFRNDYEHCKYEAERLVRAADFLDRLTVYRPATIVGDSRTGYTSTYHALYSYFHFVWVYRRHVNPDLRTPCYLNARLNSTGDEGRNMIPVDWVSAVMAYLIVHSRFHGQTYHLTPVQQVTSREIEEAASSYFNYYGVTFGGNEVLAGGELNELEKLFYAHVSAYASYWAKEPAFDCARTLAAAPHLPCPPVDVPMMHRFIEFAIQDQWGKRRRPNPRKVSNATPVLQ